MKFLKYLLGALAVLIIAFLVLGLIKPSISYERDITVEKPLEESWAVIQDEEKLPEWLSGFQRIEHVSGTPGTVGAVANVYFDDNGQTMSIKETITALVPNESISMTYASDFMDMEYTMTMTAVEGQTTISTFTIAKGNGMFSRSIMALLAGSIEQQEETHLSSLKRTIEQNTKAYSSTMEEPITGVVNDTIGS